MEDVKCTLVLYFNDMTTLKRVPTLLEQDCILSPYFCHHFLAFIFSLFLPQEQEALAHQQPRNKKKIIIKKN